MKLRKLILISGLLLGFAQTIGAQNQLITYPRSSGSGIEGRLHRQGAPTGWKVANDSHLSRQSGRSKRGPAPCKAGLHELFRLRW